MQSVKEIFTAKASSIQETFLSEMGVTSFRIPIYQRQYSWDKENIQRLVEDILEGLFNLPSIEGSISFIGTILLIEDDSEKETFFDGNSLSIVDGQQRLTTIALICALLHIEIKRHIIFLSKQNNDELINAIIFDAESISDLLFACCIGKPSGPNIKSIYDYFPRLVRQETDIRANKAHVTKYKSPVAEFLFQFCKHVVENSSKEFNYQSSAPVDIGKAFSDRLDYIQKYIEIIGTNESSSEITLTKNFPSIKELLEESHLRQTLFPKLQKHKELIKQVLEVVNKQNNHVAEPLIRLVAFGTYLLNRVAITNVIADDEKYAFDIFEALNTTGEPLTALETFKPTIIQFENNQEEKYNNSPSKVAFDEIEHHVVNFQTYDLQQRETRELVVLLALYLSGEKEALHLNSQRRYLRKVFADATGVNAKRRVAQSLADLANYRRIFWNKEVLPNQLRNHPEREIALICLSFLKDLNNSLSIPILVRYWKYAEVEGDVGILIDAVKSVTAFLVLRRAATGGTAGIDSDYRNLMNRGKNKCGTNCNPLKLGIKNQENPLPSCEELKEYLKSYLKDSKLKITTKNEWLQRVCQQPLYKSGPNSLVRFILLAVAHNSVSDTQKPYLLKKGRVSPASNYLNYQSWISDDYATIEHIAPQNKNDGWDKDIYEDVNSVHYLGNLTLLPEAHNSTVGDKPWEKKKLFYKAAAADTHDKVDKYIGEARSQGIDFGKKTNQMLIDSDCLPIITTVANADLWNVNIIKNRTKNIAELLFKELSIWLGGY